MIADPTAGDPRSIRSVALRLQQRSSGIRSASNEVRQQAAVITDGEWKAKNKTSFIAAAVEVGAGGERIASHVDRAATVLIAYATRIEQIQSEAQSIKAAQDRNHDDLSANARAVEKLRESDADDASVRVLGLSAVAAGLQVSKVALEQSWQDLVVRRRAADAEAASKLGESEVIGAFATSAAAITGMTDEQLLAFLSGLGPEEIAAFAGNTALADRLRKVLDPKAVADWWSGLGGDDGKGSRDAHSAVQEAFIAAFPVVVGNLNGVAYWARDSANRITLKSALADAKQRVQALEAQRNGPGWSPALEAQLADATKYRDQLQNFDAGRRKHYDLNREGVRQLTSLTLGPPPLGAISIGDLDTAANATYVVPGMGTTLQDSTRLLLAAANLRNAQSLFTTDDTAVVAWIGYETPGPIAGGDPSVLYDGKAHKGAPLLSAELEGYRASVGPDTKLNVVAHSYGTTMSSIAVSQSPDLGVNSYVALGSAGIPIDVPNAASLHADHVYAGTGDEWVAPGGRIGSGRNDPDSFGFGAEHLDVGPGSGNEGVNAHDPLRHDDDENRDKWGYFDEGTKSLLSTAEATTR